MPRVLHFEIIAKDTARARRFYEQVFDWNYQGFGEMDYWLAMTGPDAEPGINGAITTDMDMGQAIVNTVGVDSVDTYAERILSAGGSVVRPKMEIPGMGFVAYFRDTEGNAFGVFEALPR